MPNPNPARWLSVAICMWGGAAMTALAVELDTPDFAHPFKCALAMILGMGSFALAAKILSEKD